MYRKFEYDKESGLSTATLTDRGITAVGRAKLHPDDKRHGSELTGLSIAELRAYKKLVEKRMKKKRYAARWHQAQADYYNKLAELDKDFTKELSQEIDIFIGEKTKLYKALADGRPKPIEWVEVDSEMFSDNFKKSIRDGNPLE
jgi:hypothetical protein